MRTEEEVRQVVELLKKMDAIACDAPDVLALRAEVRETCSRFAVPLLWVLQDGESSEGFAAFVEMTKQCAETHRKWAEERNAARERHDHN